MSLAQIAGIAKRKDAELRQKISELQVATYGWNYNRTVAAGTQAGSTGRIAYKAMQACNNIRVVYANVNSSADVYDNANSYNVTIKASLETSDGDIYPISFAGKRTYAIEPGCIMVSDPIGIELAAEETFYIRTLVQVPSDTNTYPVNVVAYSMHAGDYVDSGSMSASLMYTFSPYAIVGKGTSKAWAVVGDSICAGSGETSFNQSILYLYNGGWAARALEDTANFINMSKSGIKISEYLTTDAHWNRGAIMNYCTHAICALGINDVIGSATAAAIKANLLLMWQFLVNKGLKVFQTTLTPDRSTCDDIDDPTTTSTHADGSTYDFNINLLEAAYTVNGVTQTMEAVADYDLGHGDTSPISSGASDIVYTVLIVETNGVLAYQTLASDAAASWAVAKPTDADITTAVGHANWLRVVQCQIHRTGASTITQTNLPWWASNNQVASDKNDVRIEVNDWIRTMPSSLLSGYIDIADIAETERNSGLWKPMYTNEGLHPSTVGHIAIAAGLDMSIYD